MHIRHKIFLGYLLIVAVAVVMVAVFLLTLTNINDRYKDLLNREQMVLLQAHALRAHGTSCVASVAASLTSRCALAFGPLITLPCESYFVGVHNHLIEPASA